MRRRLAWLGGALVLAALALFRHRARPGEPPQAAPPEQGPDPRAQELRRKLDEAASAQEEAFAQPPAEESPEERRRRVHEQGRAATERMQGPTEEESDA